MKRRKHVPDLFVEEVNRSIPVVLAELSAPERMLVDRVPVVVVDHLGPALNAWGAYFHGAEARYRGVSEAARIEIYRRFFSEEPDQRREEIRWVLRHEYQHALQRNFDEYAPRVDVGNGRWVDRRPLDFRRGDLVVHLPGRTA